MRARSSSSVRDILRVLFKHRGKMSLTFLVTVVGVAIATFFAPPVYETTSSLLVRFGRQFIYRSEAGRDIDDVLNRSRESIINAEIDILNSDDLQKEVIEEIGVEILYPDIAKRPASEWERTMASLRRLEEHYRVQGMNESNTLRVSFQHTDPEIAATVVNTAVTRFMQKHLEAFSGPKIADFYFEKVRAYGDKLNDIENGIRDFQTSNATVSFEEQRSLLLREAAELDKEIDGFERRRSGLTQRIRALEEEMAAQAQQIPLDEESEAESIEAQLLQLRLRERELRSQFRETDRQVVSVREQIAVVERFLSDREGASGKRVRVGRNQIYDGLENGLVHARVELAEMEAVIAPATRRRAKLLSELKLLPVREQHLGELLREREAYERSYENYEARLEDARTFADMDRQLMADISIIQSALPPAKPIRPDKRMNMAAGVLIGLVLALGTGFVFEFLRTGWDTPEQVTAQLGIPVLGSIRYQEQMKFGPAISSNRQRH